MLFSKLSAALLLPLSALVQGYASPKGCTGDCFTHDPAIVKRADGKWFRFSTLYGIGIWTASDISGPWTRSGSVIPTQSVINLPNNAELWAPDISYIRGKYYLFYSVSSSGSQTSAIGLATSTTLDAGSWVDHGEVVSSTGASPYNTIDPNFVNGTGADEFYLSWGSYWGDIYQAQVALDGDYVFASGNEKQIAYNPSGAHAVEGSFIYPKNGYYWLFLSVGACCTYTPKPAAGTEYHVVVCRSTTPTGGYVDKNGVSCTNGGGTTVLASHDNVYAPGGQGIYVDSTYGEIFYYHYLDTNVGVDYSQSKFGWNTLTWVDGWPTI